MQETNIVPDIYVKPSRISNSSSDQNRHSTLQRDSTNAGSMSYISDVHSISEIEDIELTDRDLELIDQTEDVLRRERTRRINYDRELVRTKNEMDKVMNSNFPIQIRIKLMQSLTDALQTKLKCINEESNDFKEKILRIEKLNSYMTPLRIIEDWKATCRFTSDQSDELISDIDNILSMIPTFDDAIESSNNSFLRKTVPEELKEQQRLLQKEKIDNNKMESIIVLLKQIIIPLVISIENAKDKHNDMQDLIKAKKELLEEKLKLVEDVKKKISRNGVHNSEKENINPREMNGNHSKDVKLRDIYMDYEEKSMELNLSRMNMSSTNTTMFQEASSKMSKVFGNIFKSKKNNVPEKIFTTDVLQDLGIQPNSQRSGNIKS